MDQFNIHAAKTQFSKLIARVRNGEEILIARAGKPVCPTRSRPPAAETGAGNLTAVPDDP